MLISPRFNAATRAVCFLPHFSSYSQRLESFHCSRDGGYRSKDKSSIGRPSVFVRQPRCKVTCLPSKGNDLCSARMATYLSGMDGAVVLDQLFQHDSLISAKQLSLKQLVHVSSLPAFRFEGSDTLYWTAIHADDFRDYLDPLPTHPSNAAWRRTWVYL